MKKLLSVVLAVVLLMSATPLGAFDFNVNAGDVFTYGNLKYQYGSSNNLIVVGLADYVQSTSITIPETVNGYNVTYIEEEAFMYGNIITHVKIPCHVGPRAFQGCSNLKTVEFYKEKSIGGIAVENQAFYGCRSLNTIIRPGFIRTICDQAFYNTAISEIELGDVSIDDEAFGDCGNLKKVTFTGDISIYGDVFEGCNYLKKLYLYGRIVTNYSLGVYNDDFTIYSCNNSYASKYDYNYVSIPHEYSYACDDKCNYCYATRTAADHQYTNVCDEYCNMCGVKRETEGHSYISTCDNDCEKCGEERYIWCGSHTFSYKCDEICDVCGHILSLYEKREIGVEEHIYISDCDKDCDVCGEIRTKLKHTYTNDCDKDCDVCGETRIEIKHTYTNDCDKDCDVCGETRTEIKHTYTNGCDKDCDVCGETRTELTHTYTNNCDEECNLCKNIRVAPHMFSYKCDVSCNGCDLIREPTAEHTYNNSLDASCNLCEYVRVIKSWEVNVAETGVYNIKPSVALTGFNNESIIVLDKQDNTIKYNITQKGWPLVKGETYRIKFNVEYTNVDDLSWKLIKNANTIFPDTHSGAWYIDAVTYAVGAGIINGYNNGKFGTSDNIQRQDFLVMLSRLDNVNLTYYGEQKSSFPDVPEGSYYEAAVNWGAKKGIVTGYDNGKFGVGDKVTREQLVTFLYRYVKYKKIDTYCTSTQKKAVKDKYIDFKNVSDFASDPIIWAVTKGVIAGKNKNTIAPQGNAQRCEVAKIMHNIYLNDIF